MKNVFKVMFLFFILYIDIFNCVFLLSIDERFCEFVILYASYINRIEIFLGSLLLSIAVVMDREMNPVTREVYMNRHMGKVNRLIEKEKFGYKNRIKPVYMLMESVLKNFLCSLSVILWMLMLMKLNVR